MTTSPRPDGRTTRQLAAPAPPAATLVAGTLIVPLVFWIGTDESFIVPKLWAASAVVAVALAQLVVHRRAMVRYGPTPVDLAVAAWIALVLVSFVSSVDHGQSLWGERFQRQGAYAAILYALTFGVARSTVVTTARIRLVARALSLAATIVAGYAIVQRAGLDPIWDDIPSDRVFSTIGQTNSLGAVLALSLPLSVGLILADPRRRPLHSVAALVQVLALGLTLSRGAYLALAVSTLMLGVFVLLRRGWRGPGALAVVVAATTAGAIVAVLIPGPDAVSSRVIDRATDEDEWSTGSIRNHLDLWVVAGHIIVDHPLVGTGPDTYPEVFGDYRDDVLSAESARRLRVFRVESAHNIVLTTAQGSGIPAAVAHVGALGLAVVFAVRRGLSGADSSVIWLAVATAITGGFVASMFITADFTTTWITFLLAGACSALAPAGGRGGDDVGSWGP